MRVPMAAPIEPPSLGVYRSSKLSSTFDAAHLTYGFNMRNLTALQALDAMRRFILY